MSHVYSKVQSMGNNAVCKSVESCAYCKDAHLPSVIRMKSLKSQY